MRKPSITVKACFRVLRFKGISVLVPVAGILLLVGACSRSREPPPDPPPDTPKVDTKSPEPKPPPKRPDGDPDKTPEATPENPGGSTKTPAKGPSGADAAYDKPEGAPGVSTGHAVVLVGIDTKSRTLFIHEPADNLVEDLGIHRWGVPPSRIRYEYGNGYLRLHFWKLHGYASGAIYIDDRGAGAKVTDPYISKVPDLSQHAIRPGWENMCVPACAASLIFFHNQKFPALLSRMTDRHPARDERANVMIAGLGPDFPTHSSIAGYMGTSTRQGTRTANIVLGLERFLQQETEIPPAFFLVKSVPKVGQPLLNEKAFEGKLEALLERQLPCILGVDWNPPKPDHVEFPTGPEPEGGGEGEGEGGGEGRGIFGRWKLDHKLSYNENTGDDGLYHEASAQAPAMLNAVLGIYAECIFEITPNAIILHEGKKETRVPATFKEGRAGQYEITCTNRERLDFVSCKRRRGRLHLVLKTYRGIFILVCKP